MEHKERAEKYWGQTVDAGEVVEKEEFGKRNASLWNEERENTCTENLVQWSLGCHLESRWEGA